MTDYNIKPWLEGLNEEQRTSAEKRGHVCVVARAGTGKTKGLVARVIDQIIGEEKDSQRIILFTFTNLAADEMRKRLIQSHCPVPYYTGTFHRVCNKLMRNFPFLYGKRNKDVLFLDEDGVKNFIRDQIIPKITPEDMQYMLELAGGEEHFPKMANLIKSFSNAISILKSSVITPKDIENQINLPLWIDNILNKTPVVWHLVQNYYSLYEELMQERNLMDFDDMINVPLGVLENSSEAREIVSRHFDTILVDEHQDSSTAQVRLLNALSQYAELYTVGDDGQSIYGWRGADVGFIRTRMAEPDVHSIALFRNYRSCSRILALGDIILSYDRNVSDVKFQASGKNAKLPNKPVMTAYNSMNEEMIGVSKKIKTMMNEGTKLSDIAILCRTRNFATMIGNQLAKTGIAFKSNEFTLWESKDVKFIMALLTIADNPEHPGNSSLLHNIFEGPIKLGIGKAGIQKMKDKIEQNGFMETLKTTAISIKKNNALRQIVNTIEDIHLTLHDRDLVDIVNRAFIDSGLHEQITQETDEAYHRLSQTTMYSPLRGKIEEEYEHQNRRLKRIESELTEACVDTTYDELKLQSVIGGQSRQKEINRDAVNILTIHAAKGLEFKHVFIVGCTDSMMGTEDEYSPDFGESCRLLYVAITRAEESLDLSFSAYQYNKPQEMCHLFKDISPDILKLSGFQPWQKSYNGY